MATLESLPERPGVPPQRRGRPPAYELSLQMADGAALLTVSGALDNSAADAIGGTISADGPVTCAVDLDAASVTAVDPLGLELLVATARERFQHGLPPVRLVAVSDVLSRAMAGVGLSTRPPIFLAEQGNAITRPPLEQLMSERCEEES